MFKWTHKLQLQHPCRKTVDPRCFSDVTKTFEVFQFFSICSWISLNVTQMISRCLNGRIKCPSDVLVKKLWQNGRKCFAHIETFLNKMQKSYSQCPETKKRKNFTPKIIKKFSGHAKSSWEIIVAKAFAKKYKMFLWKSEKTTKLLPVFQFLLFSKLILWAQRMHLSQSTVDSWKSGLLSMPDFFSTKKRKNVAKDPKIFEKVLNFFRKRHFRQKCPIEMQIRQPRQLFFAKRLMNFWSNYQNP